MEATRYPTEFVGLTQNPKKNIATPNQPIKRIKTKKISKKLCLKVERSQKFVWATRRNLQTRPKIIKKIIGTSNQPIERKFSQKKVCLVP
jgi:hypothetical protein